jgi:glyceraldehyde-3-phosphate dehydrogenase/erythrose-4-phosphate dehydrogenase
MDTTRGRETAMARITIHGFGRIGRSTLRAALRDASFTILGRKAHEL